MKPLEPNFEIYDLNGKFLVRYVKPQDTFARRHVTDSMENALRFIQSFYEKPNTSRVVQFKKTDADKPRHPYDRDDDFWENQEGMTTQTPVGNEYDDIYEFTLERDDDKTD